MLTNISDLILELDNYNRDRDFLDTYYIAERLNLSMNSYLSELDDSIKSLMHKNELKIAKEINEYNGAEE